MFSYFIRRNFSHLRPGKLMWPEARNAFADRSFFALLRTALVYKACSMQSLAQWTPKILEYLGKLHVDRVALWFIKNTIYTQFCGGESLDEVGQVIAKLKAKGIGSIIDYASETHIAEGSDHEVADEVLENLVKAIDLASLTECKYVALKLTPIFGLSNLETLQAEAQHLDFCEALEVVTLHAMIEEKLSKICDVLEYAKKKSIRVAIDAENSFVQDCVDVIAINLMQRFNSCEVASGPTVMNTYQMYRKDGLDRLRIHLEFARKNSLHMGVKLVRGAYLEGEREWARQNNRECPIWDTIEETHDQYDRAADLMLSQLGKSERTSFDVIFATHNRRSAELIAEKLERIHSPSQNTVALAQLLGMSDGLTYQLAEIGIPVLKYVPYGPVKEVIPYLVRRANENSSIFGLAKSDANAVMTELRKRILLE